VQQDIKIYYTAIHREVSGFYFSNSVPKTDKILAVVNEELNLDISPS
jgi:hypothetical protein